MQYFVSHIFVGFGESCVLGIWLYREVQLVVTLVST